MKALHPTQKVVVQHELTLYFILQTSSAREWTKNIRACKCLPNPLTKHGLLLQAPILFMVGRMQETQIVVLGKGYIIILPRSRVSGWTTVAMSAVCEESD